ncbi:AbrB/MazE/SpoVT family DNA-binding domain-containing protein [candidate division WWE3 bacterium]|nr:AbrB/MazE/SpoVT family DNA-binding domain-containing protein [candidate division WWE3 bacterium]
MTYLSSLTQKGQVTIPHEIRSHLGLRPFDKVIFIRGNKDVVLRPAKDFLKLKGSIKGNIKYSDTEADKYASRTISDEYEKASRS